jgi:hypothetical protein
MLTDSKITSEHGDAVYILGGNVTLKNTEIETNDGQGVNVNRYSTFNMDGGVFLPRVITPTGSGLAGKMRLLT